MALTYSQWIWGFEVFDAGAGASQNNMIDLQRANWQASHAYSLNVPIGPAGANSNSLQVWKVTTSGTSGGSQPTWPSSPTPGVTTQTDGTVTWTFQNTIGIHPAVAAGVYTPDELATAVTAALTAADAGNSYTCTFSYSTLLFTIAGTSTFDVKWSTGTNHTKNMSGLLGFNNATDKNGNTSLPSDSAIGGTYSTASLWTAAEPLASMSPVTAQAVGSPALLTRRAMRIIQNITDGMTCESIYFGTLKSVQVSFTALLASEQTSMENFLNWIVQGKRFIWQPDKTSTNGLKLVAANPGQVNDMYQWLTRPEISYGTLSFYEQLS
jgi:hypothetical protein